MKETKEWKIWWKSLPANQRYPLMEKYKVKWVSEKLIKKMWKGEIDNSIK